MTVENTSSQSLATNIPQRLVVLDLIRGIAVLGILVMNIQFFSQPISAYSNPTSYGDFSGINFWIWAFSHVLFDQKFIAIFSLLFGVGVLIFLTNLTKKNLSPYKFHFARMVFLLLFGIVHGLFIWAGDILVSYALCGMIIYWFRHSKSSTLLVSACFLILLFSTILFSLGVLIPILSDDVLTQEIQNLWHPTPLIHQLEVAAYNGNWLQVNEQRIYHKILIQLDSFYYFPHLIALMFIGMTLFKTGLIQGIKSSRFYLTTGLGLTLFGWTCSALGIYNNVIHQFSWDYSLFQGSLYNYWGSVFSSLGYIALIIFWYQCHGHSLIKRLLINVGQMAFTNYILQSLICTSIIYGYGFGLFGQLARLEQIFFVVTIWTALLVFSSVWLRYFRFGPLEWLWRSLTYMSWQPIRHIKNDTELM